MRGAERCESSTAIRLDSTTLDHANGAITLVPNQRIYRALLNPVSFKEERARLSGRRRTYGRTDGRTDGRLHNSDSRDEGSKTRRKRGIVLRAVHKKRRLESEEGGRVWIWKFST